MGPLLELNEADLIGLNIIILLVKAQDDVPDFHAAADILDVITQIILGTYCDIETFLIEGEILESKLKILEIVLVNPLTCDDEANLNFKRIGSFSIRKKTIINPFRQFLR